MRTIKSFHDLDFYRDSYNLMLIIFKEILPKLPPEEKYDLASQLRRSAKAIPRLIAEGYSKRHQKKGFQQYLATSLAESNETIVSISQVKDLYLTNSQECLDLINRYDKLSRQIDTLAKSWKSFS